MNVEYDPKRVNDPKYIFVRKNSALGGGSKIAKVGIISSMVLMLSLMFYVCDFNVTDIIIITVCSLLLEKVNRFFLFNFFVKKDYSEFVDSKWAKPFFMYDCYVSGFSFGSGVSAILVFLLYALLKNDKYLNLS